MIIRNQSIESGSSDASVASLRQQTLGAAARKSAPRKSGFKSTTVAAYFGMFLLVVSLVAVGYKPPVKSDQIAANLAPQNVEAISAPSVDTIVATNVAASIAERADLPIAANIANLSLSLEAQKELSQTDANVISKPQIVEPTASSRAIRTYKTVRGDSVAKVAQKYDVAPTTIRWANDLSSDALQPGKTLKIPSTDGVLYTLKSNDTVASLASKYKASPEVIVAYNDLENIGKMPAGRQIVIPGGQLPANEQPGYVAPTSSSQANTATGAFGNAQPAVDTGIASASAGNRYALGNCTWYVYERRAQLGRPVGSFWGNASSWASYAAAAGFRVDSTPEVGAVAQWNSFQGGSGYAGHVAVVERVNSDGTIFITEMNFAGNFNRVTQRTISASSVSNYIH